MITLCLRGCIVTAIIFRISVTEQLKLDKVQRYFPQRQCEVNLWRSNLTVIDVVRCPSRL